MPWETPLHYSYLLFSLNCIECLLLVEHQNFSLCTVRFLGRDLHAQWPNGQISVSAEGGHADEWTNAVFLLLQSWLEVPSQTERAGETEEEKLQVCISSFHCGTTSSGGGGEEEKKGSYRFNASFPHSRCGQQLHHRRTVYGSHTLAALFCIGVRFS